MKTVCITAEYNPFHNGHAYQIAEAKRVSGADRALIVMSGSFVQRGEPACADKFVRAGWAISGGADMVIELPEVFSLACAERFASGAVRIMKCTGLADAICFGSESGDAEELTRIALSGEDSGAVANGLSRGLSYPAAVAEAAGGGLAPNDILGAEYIRAAKKHSPETEIYAVKRMGAGYADETLGGEFSSAGAIRRALSGARYAKLSPAVLDGLNMALPRNVLEDISRMISEGSFPADLAGLSDAVLFAFRSMSAQEIAALPEIAEGLENLFARYSAECSDAEEMLSKVKSKRYTMARLKRAAMNALLGMTEELQRRAAGDDGMLYARVLAMREDAEEMLSALKKNAAIPVIVRAADREELPEAAKEILRIGELAHLIRALGQPYEKHAAADGSHRLIVR